MGSYAKTATPQTLNLAHARLLVCESNAALRPAIRAAINNLGINDVIEANSYPKARQAMELETFDAVILDADMDGYDTCPLLRETRLGRLGSDPFVISILLLDSTDPVKLRRAVNCGTDDLLLIPFSSGNLASRLDAFKFRRKPFIITHDYIGPDRRKNERSGKSLAVATIAPPNPLAARAISEPPEHYARQKSQAAQVLKRERIKRLAVATEWECRQMLTVTTGGQGQHELLLRAFAKLEALLSELTERVAGTGHHDNRPLRDMQDKLRTAKNRLDDLELVDFDGLHTTARRIAITYNGG